MLSLLLISLFAATEPPIRVTAVGVSYVNIDVTEGDAYVDAFANALASDRRFEVVTRSQVAQAIGLDRQRQLLGCDTGSSCFAELAGALGAGLVVTGSLGKLGQVFTVSLKLVDANSGRTVAFATERLGSEGALLEALDRIATDFIQARFPPARRPVAPTVIAALAGAGVALVTSASLFVVAGTAQDRLVRGPFDSAREIRETSALGAGTQVGAWTAMGVAVAAGLTSLLLQLIAAPTVAWVPRERTSLRWVLW